MLADEIDTPFYCYSTATLERHYRVFDEAFDGIDHAIFYSMKANSNQAVVKTLADLGAGIDVVSEGELRRALALGVPGRKIVFSGVGKTAREMALGAQGVDRLFQCRIRARARAPEFSIAIRLGTRAPVSIRINPDVDAETHEKITTGKARTNSAFPICAARDVYARAAALPGIEIRGIDMHIGSQITELEPFARPTGCMAELIAHLARATATTSAMSISAAASAFPIAAPMTFRRIRDEYARLVKRTLRPPRRQA